MLKTDAKACSLYIGPFWHPRNYEYFVSLKTCVLGMQNIYTMADLLPVLGRKGIVMLWLS